jgi:hypothetical protein
MTSSTMPWAFTLGREDLVALDVEADLLVDEHSGVRQREPLARPAGRGQDGGPRRKRS